MQAAQQTSDAGLAGQTLSVKQHVDHAGVRTAREDHQAAVAHVDDERLVIPDHRIGLPAIAVPRLVDRKATFELGDPLDLPGNQNGAIEQEAVRALLDHLKPVRLKILTARRRQSQLAARGKGNSSFAPSIGVNHQRQPRTPPTADQPLETAVMSGVTVRDDDRAQVTHRDLKHVEVAGHGVRREASVVEHGAPLAAPLDADQRREAMLSNQLLSRAEVPRLVANHTLLAGHQHVKEVVDHDRHLDAIHRGEHAPILRHQPARANATQHRKATTDADACSAALRKSGQGCSGALLWNELENLARGRRGAETIETERFDLAWSWPLLSSGAEAPGLADTAPCCPR